MNKNLLQQVLIILISISISIYSWLSSFSFLKKLNIHFLIKNQFNINTIGSLSIELIRIVAYTYNHRGIKSGKRENSFNFSSHHVRIHVPYHVHTVHHHHVKKVAVPIVEKVPVPVPVPIHHVEKVAVPVPVHHVEKVHVPVPVVEKVPVPIPVHEEKKWW